MRIHRRPGEPVAAGETLFTLYTDTPERFEGAMAEMDGGWNVGAAVPEIGPLIIDRIGLRARVGAPPTRTVGGER
jgi:thymidine phosphorylase